MESIFVRAATPSDYPSFAQLFEFLATGDAVSPAQVFERELMPGMWVAERGERVVGYVYVQQIAAVCYVRHLAVFPNERRLGIGRALLERARDAGVAAGAREWCLNVKPDNTSAIALYRAMGMHRVHTATVLRVDWSDVPRDDVGVAAPSAPATPISAADDPDVERALGLLAGQLANARALGRVLLVVRDGATPVAGCIFDPSFPGAYPFRVAGPPNLAARAVSLLAGMRAHANGSWVQLVVEEQTDLVSWLQSIGARVHMQLDHMSMPLAPAS